ncbi:MAG: ribonuclease HI [Planctomycetota bacterium]|nr:ribonuclease HI [Planctomycetota bacterium]
MPWERRTYRQNKVWVEVDSHGQAVLDERGLASLRYRPDDSRTYSVRPEELGALVGAPEAVPEAVPEEGLYAAPAAELPPPPHEDAIVIHTDGACSGNPGPAGLGVVLTWHGRRREIQRHLGSSTNNEAELAAVLAGLEAVRRPDLRVEIRTDSTYVIGMLTQGHKAKKNIALVERIRTEMARFADLHFIKVPAHAGVPDNERADRLARDAIRHVSDEPAPPE